MTGDEVIAALDLPAAARVDRRVPKTLLLEHGARSAADRRHIGEGVERIQWVAALKPATIGVAAYRDEAREYLEIAILRLVLRGGAKVPRLLELVHRAVPYPLLVVAEADHGTSLSLAHKRWSLGEVQKTVLDGDLVAVDAPGPEEPHRPAFAAALTLGNQPRSSLRALYQGWIDALHALESARKTGRYHIPSSEDLRTARRQALEECACLEVEMVRLRAAAAKEKQMGRQVELNLELKRAEAAHAAALERL